MRYLIDGCYGDGNIGDECLLNATIRVIQLNDVAANICVMSESPQETTNEFGVESVQQCNPFGRGFYGAFFKLQILSTLLAIFRCDIFILGGGELFRDDKGIRATLGMFYRLCLARLLGRRTFAWGVGLQRPKTLWGRFVVRQALKSCDGIIFRDQSSYELSINSFGIRCNVVLSQDPVFSIDGFKPLRRIRQKSAALRIGIALKSLPKTHPSHRAIEVELLNAIEQWVRSKVDCESVEVVMLPFSSADLELSQRLSCRLPENAEQVAACREDLQSAFASLDIVIAAPLHASVFAFASGVPCIGVAYDEKIARLYKSFGHEQAVVPIDEISATALAAIAQRLLDENTREQLLRHSASAKTSFLLKAQNMLIWPSDLKSYVVADCEGN